MLASKKECSITDLPFELWWHIGKHDLEIQSILVEISEDYWWWSIKNRRVIVKWFINNDKFELAGDLCKSFYSFPDNWKAVLSKEPIHRISHVPYIEECKEENLYRLGDLPLLDLGLESLEWHKRHFGLPLKVRILDYEDACYLKYPQYIVWFDKGDIGSTEMGMVVRLQHVNLVTHIFVVPKGDRFAVSHNQGVIGSLEEYSSKRAVIIENLQLMEQYKLNWEINRIFMENPLSRPIRLIKGLAKPEFYYLLLSEIAASELTKLYDKIWGSDISPLTPGEEISDSEIDMSEVD